MVGFFMSIFLNKIQRYAQLTDEEITLVRETMDKVQEEWQVVEENTHANQIKILEAFQKNQVADFHLNGSTGYGYGDTGRDVLESVWADLFCAEKALVRSNLVSGTHA